MVLVIGSLQGLKFYNKFFKPNVVTSIQKDYMLYVPTGAQFGFVMNKLVEDNVLKDTATFSFAAGYMKYKNNVKAGRYAIHGGMTNRQLIQTLRSKNVPVRLVINKKRLVQDFVDYIAPKFEFSDSALLGLLANADYLSEQGFDTYNALTVFLPNTYEVWWNSSAEGFYSRMMDEYNRFWSDERLRMAAGLGLSPEEVIALASIVEEEVRHEDEKTRVAGLYLNRIEMNMLLQADPTLKFAWKDFGLRRVLNRHKTIDSPFNTYKYTGLPPGPICIPQLSSIDAVLNAEEHDYLFMCAKADFSGYHAFAKTNAQHEQNAAAYQAELNRRGIR